MMGEKKRWQSIFPFLLLVGLATLFFYPVIFEGKTFYAFDILQHFLPWSPQEDFRPENPLISDPVNAFYPRYHYLKTAISKGVFPLWDQSIFCGMPYTLPNNPLVYLLHVFFPLTVAHDFLLWFHLLGTGLFMVLYLREIGLHPCAALIGSAAWMFNGYVMVWFEFENVLMMAFSLPLMLYSLELWLRTRSKFSYTLIICAISLSISANNYHLLIYEFFLVAFYCLCRPGSPSRGERRRRRGIGWKEVFPLAAACLLGICISANLFTTHWSFQEDPQRTVFSFEGLFEQVGRLPAKYLVTLLFPDFYGSPAVPPCFIPGPQAYNNYNELCVYGGVPTLLLGLASIPYWRERYVGFFLLSAFISLTMAMGSVLYYPLASWVPGLNLSTPTRTLYVFGFSLSVLAGLGSHMLLTRNDPRKWWAVAGWMLVLGLAVGLIFLVQTVEGVRWATDSVKGVDPEEMYRLMRSFFELRSPILLKPMVLLFCSVGLLMAWVLLRRRTFMGCILIVLLVDLMSFGWIYNTASPTKLEYPETGGIRFLRKDPGPFRVIPYGNFFHNTLAPFGIQDIGGYSSFYPKRHGDFLHLSQSGGGAPPLAQYNRWTTFITFGSPLLDLVNAKYLLVAPDVFIHTEKAELVYSGEMRIFRNKHAFPRAFFVPHFRLMANRMETYWTMARFSEADFRKWALLESPPPPDFGTDEGDADDAQHWEIRIVSYQPNGMDLEVSAPRKGFVLIGDSFHPGWKARVDGEDAPVIRANYIMRAIPVKKGEHQVTLRFRPTLLLTGVVVSAVGWCALGILLGLQVVFGALAGIRNGSG